MNSYNSATEPKSTSPLSEPVSFAAFAALARRRGWTSASLAERFRGKVENATEFFNRIMAGKCPELVIPYRSIIAFYIEQTLTKQHTPESERVCACGCGAQIFARQKWALPGCKKRIARQHVSDTQKRVGQVIDFVNARPGQNGRMATDPLNSLPTRDKRRLNGCKDAGEKLLLYRPSSNPWLKSISPSRSSLAG